MSKNIAPSKKTGAKTIYAAFKLMKQAGGELPGRELIKKIPQEVTLSEWEKATLETSGNIRWQSIFHFYSIHCTKAGFLLKNKGKWILTPEGELAMKKGEMELIEMASQAYKKWKSENDKGDTEFIETNGVSEHEQKAVIEQLEIIALNGLKEYIKKQNPYEFQNLVAALLRGMGYFTPFISPKGKDGGIDIIAYQDPIGVKSPRIKVQVKHRPDAIIAVDDIRSLAGIVDKNNEVGMVVTSGRFSSDSQREARSGKNAHIELIDFERLIDLWQEFYSKMNDEDKNHLPLQAVYFLGSNE